MKKLTQVIAIAAVTAAITLMSTGSNEAASLSSRSEKIANKKSFQNQRRSTLRPHTLNPRIKPGYWGGISGGVVGNSGGYRPPTSQPTSPGNDTVVGQLADLIIVGNPIFCNFNRPHDFVKVTIKNIGRATSNQSRFSIRWENDQKQLLKNFVVSTDQLMPGQSKTLGYWGWPSVGFTEGMKTCRHVKLTVDYNSQVRELNENNNVRYINVVVPPVIPPAKDQEDDDDDDDDDDDRDHHDHYGNDDDDDD